MDGFQGSNQALIHQKNYLLLICKLRISVDSHIKKLNTYIINLRKIKNVRMLGILSSVIIN